MIVRRSQQTKIIASLLAASILASCSPKLQPAKEYPQAQMVFTTSQTDAKLEVEETKPQDLLKHLSANTQMKTGTLFQSVHDLYSLADANDSTELKNLANGINNQFYSSLNTTAKVRFEQSPIILAAIGYGKGYTDLLANLLNLVEGSVKSYPWPQDIKFKDYEVESQKYVSWLIPKVRAELAKKKIDLSDETIAKGEDAINKQIAERQTGLQEATEGLKVSESVEMLLSNASDFIAESLTMDLESEKLAGLKALLNSVTEIAPKVDAIADKKTAGKALADAKSVLTDEELKQIDSTAAPEAIKASLTQALASKILDQTEQAASAHGFPQLPNQLLALGSMGVGLDPELVKEIARDPKAALKKLAAQFGEAKLASAPAGITGVESSEIDLVFQSSSLKISGRNPKNSKEIKTSAETIGTSLSNSIAKIIEADKQLAAALKEPQNEETQAQIEQKRKETNALIFSQLNKLVLMSGFKTEENKVASFTKAVDTGKPVELLDEKASSNKVAAVGDDITVSKNLTPVDSKKTSVSVRGQAALLKGLSDTISYLRDWKKNGFDRGLGQVTMAQLLGSEATEGPLAKSAFDKSLLFTVAIGNAGTILEGINEELTPFYLVGPRESAVWINEQPVDKDGNVIPNSRATVGIVDVVNSERTVVSKTGDIARYILSVMDFIEATEGIEKTTSSILTKKDPETGVSKLDKLLGGRGQLRTLLTGLSNMLSGRLQQQDGSFAAQFNMNSKEVSGKASTADTALAIQALAKAGNEFGAKAYQRAALDAYYAMNKTLWNKDLQFYSQSEANSAIPSYDELVSILNSINTLAPHMPAESKAQWDAIAKNWVKALELLSKNLAAAATK